MNLTDEIQQIVKMIQELTLLWRRDVALTSLEDKRQSLLVDELFAKYEHLAKQGIPALAQIAMILSSQPFTASTCDQLYVARQIYFVRTVPSWDLPLDSDLSSELYDLFRPMIAFGIPFEQWKDQAEPARQALLALFRTKSIQSSEYIEKKKHLTETAGFILRRLMQHPTYGPIIRGSMNP